MASTAVDSSVVIAALLTWHEAHEAAFGNLENAIASGDDIVLPVPALIEAYAVMTRLPAPHRLSAGDAFGLLGGSLRGVTRLIGLPGRRVWRFLEDLVAKQAAGGTTYDAQILECARIGGANSLLTLNPRDFERLNPEQVEIVEPV